MTYQIGDTVLNGWRIQQVLGSGSFGRVYQISKTVLGAADDSALKVITVQPPGVGDALGCTTPPEKIVEEYTLMRRLRDCPHVVRCEDVQKVDHTEDSGCDILIRMELLTPLPQYQADRPLTAPEVVRLGRELCDALEECGRQHIIHRDIKPDNILVAGNGMFKLGDFGIARVMQESQASSHAGTNLYIAPEVLFSQITGARYGPTVDIYSLGIVLYQLLNHGRIPFLPPYPQELKYEDMGQALSRRNRGEPLPPPDSASPALAAVILKACAYQAEERWQSAREMKQALEAATGQQSDVDLAAARRQWERQERQAQQAKETQSARPGQQGRSEQAAETLCQPQQPGKGQPSPKQPSPSAAGQPYGATQLPPNSRQTQPPKKKKRAWLFPVILLAAATLILSLIYGIPAYQQEQTYRQATAIYELGNYSRAAELFQSLGDYQDSADWLAKAQAKAAEAAEPEGAVAFAEPAYAKVGDAVLFGTYEQDNNTDNGKESIAWQVLYADEWQLMLVSAAILDCQPYHSTQTPVTWETCTLRQWLNEDFYQAAFSAEEQGQIMKMTVENSDNAVTGIDGGADTEDKVILLSVEQAEHFFSSDSARQIKPTSYAKAQGVWMNDTDYGWLWLRTPGITQSRAACIGDTGAVYAPGSDVSSDDGGVWPAITISRP